jgi:hypothetical protein
MADEKLDTPVDEVVDEYVTTWRFHIERLVTGADSRADGLQELWHVVARVDGVWDGEVLRDFLDGQPAEPARYRVIRYTTDYTEMAEFDVKPITRWDVERVEYRAEEGA